MTSAPGCAAADAATPDEAPVHPVRIPPLPREDWTEAARDVFAFWGEPDARENGSRTTLVMVLASHPALANAYNTFGRHLLIDSTLPVRPRELVVLRVSWRTRCAYEWHYHVGYALNQGMSLDEVAAVRLGAGAPIWTARDRAVLAAIDELMDRHAISDATWAALSAHLAREQIMDLVFTVGNYVMLSAAIAAFGVQLEDGVDRIDFDLTTASGVLPAARFRPGETADWASNSGVERQEDRPGDDG